MDEHEVEANGKIIRIQNENNRYLCMCIYIYEYWIDFMPFRMPHTWKDTHRSKVSTATGCDRKAGEKFVASSGSAVISRNGGSLDDFLSLMDFTHSLLVSPEKK